MAGHEVRVAEVIGLEDRLAALGGGGGGPVSWDDVTGKPTFAAVATSGTYSDLTGRPAIPDDPADIGAQPHDTQLDEWATLDPSTLGGQLVIAAAAGDVRALLGLVLGTDVQAYDADLAALAAMSATDVLAYRGGSGWTTTPLTTAGRDLLDDADAAAQRATLGLTVAWTAMDFTSAAAKFTTNATNPARYRLLPDNRVEVRGRVDVSGGAGVVAADRGPRLGVPARPVAARRLAGLTNLGTLADFDVGTAGHFDITRTQAGVTNVVLDGLSFYRD